MLRYLATRYIPYLVNPDTGRWILKGWWLPVRERGEGRSKGRPDTGLFSDRGSRRSSKKWKVSDFERVGFGFNSKGHFDILFFHYPEQMPEIRACLTEIESCFQLLLPRYDIPLDTRTHSTTNLNSKQSAPPLNAHDSRQSCTLQSHSRDASCPQSHASCHGSGKCEGRTCSITSSGSFHSIGYSEGDLDEDEEEMEEAVPSHTDLRQMQEEHEMNPSEKGEETNRGNKRDPKVDQGGHGQEKIDSSGSEGDSDSDVEWGDLLVAGGGPSKGMAGLAAHGIVSRDFALTIDLPRTVEVKEGEDNESILATLRERQAILDSKFFPMINKWIEVRNSFCQIRELPLHSTSPCHSLLPLSVVLSSLSLSLSLPFPLPSFDSDCKKN